jgi:hypothetical protein
MCVHRGLVELRRPSLESVSEDAEAVLIGREIYLKSLALHSVLILMVNASADESTPEFRHLFLKSTQALISDPGVERISPTSELN